jgi:hypothetical protein
MFFYGTLKRGQSNHERFCRDAVRIEPAKTLGQLYELPFGFPGLRVDAASVRAVGTRDYLADARNKAKVLRRSHRGQGGISCTGNCSPSKIRRSG